MTGVQIRRATREDLPSISAIEDATYGPAERWTLEDYTDDYENPDSLYLVAEVGTEITGYVAGICGRSGFYVSVLTVTEKARGHGLGRLLLRRLIQEAAADRYRLHVRADNLGAITLYKGEGFIVTRRLKNYYDTEIDGVHMVLDLRSGDKVHMVNKRQP